MRWKAIDKTDWYRVFAWVPVETVCKTMVWLEWVEYRDKNWEQNPLLGTVYRRPAQYRVIDGGGKE
jgi:hypothetical protein